MGNWSRISGSGPGDRGSNLAFSFAKEKVQPAKRKADCILTEVRAGLSNKEGVNMPVKTGEFKGYKVITLMRGDDDKYPFTFGVSKAKMILENLDEIKKFVEENEQGE